MAENLAKRDARILKLASGGMPRREVAAKCKVTLNVVENVIKQARKLKAQLESAPGVRTARPVSAIKIGERHRKDFGDLVALTRSIDENGLLQPIAITPSDDLIAGERRLRAWQMSRFKDEDIPVHVVDIAAIVRGEWAENAERKGFTPSEIVAIKRAMEPAFKAAAKERQGARNDLESSSRGSRGSDADASERDARADVAVAPAAALDGDVRGNSPDVERAPMQGAGAERHKPEGPARSAGPTGAKESGRAADQFGAFVGKDRKTIAKMEAVVTAAEEDPARFGKLKDDMDRTGRVDGPFRRLEVMRQTDAIRSAPPPAPMNGPYGGIVIDYPWPHEPGMSQAEIDAAGRSMRPYPAMAIDSGIGFMREQVAPLVADDCMVAFWVTNFHMRYAYRLLDALDRGSEATILTWVKDRIGRGQTLRDKTEHVIFWRIGAPVVNLTNETTALMAKRRENSRKPDEFYTLFEGLIPATRYADIFSRGGRGERWDCHGDQVGTFDPAVAGAAGDPEEDDDGQIDLEQVIEQVPAFIRGDLLAATP